MKLAAALFLVLTLFQAGCGQKPPPATPKTAAPKASSSPSMVTAPSSAPDPATPPPPGPAATGQTVPAGGPAAIPVAPAYAGVDFATAARPADASGRQLSDLEWLNQIVLGYLTTATMADVALPKGPFKSLDEETAARMEAVKKKQQAAVVHDLSDFVKKGVIKSIPAAPQGKKYMFDQTTRRVVMVDQ